MGTVGVTAGREDRRSQRKTINSWEDLKRSRNFLTGGVGGDGSGKRNWRDIKLRQISSVNEQSPQTSAAIIFSLGKKDKACHRYWMSGFPWISFWPGSQELGFVWSFSFVFFLFWVWRPHLAVLKSIPSLVVSPGKPRASVCKAHFHWAASRAHESGFSLHGNRKQGKGKTLRKRRPFSSYISMYW